MPQALKSKKPTKQKAKRHTKVYANKDIKIYIVWIMVYANTLLWPQKYSQRHYNILRGMVGVSAHCTCVCVCVRVREGGGDLHTQ